MKTGIHPKYVESTIICACGAQHKTFSTRTGLKVDVCSNCHPFYTGEQRIMDTAGRVDKFLKRIQSRKQK